MRARTEASARVCSLWIGFVWVHVPPKVRERTRFACYPLVCVHNYVERAKRVHVYMRRAVCSAGERLAFDEFVPRTATHILLSFFFLCLSLLDEQYVIAVEKNRPMNFSEAFIVMHGHSRRGCSINYRLFYCVILVIDISYTRNYWNILCPHFVKYAWKKYFINISIHKELKRLFVFEIFTNVFQVCNSFWRILNERFEFNNLNRALNYFNKIIFN